MMMTQILRRVAGWSLGSRQFQSDRCGAANRPPRVPTRARRISNAAGRVQGLANWLTLDAVALRALVEVDGGALDFAPWFACDSRGLQPKPRL
jgi:hypothetical protein